ncbi:UNVERIFIED_CONTAM: hypothetical protein Scaly_0601600 [Sesamum calycinum]|uniref:DUF8040 domain-containing protein n=1 Tax=Sesamum calycinum TaxID=2727403 RepID=A0AAW2RSK3_9LAMI
MLVSLSNASCLRNLRIERNAFGRLCHLLEHSGGMSNTKHVTVVEQVAMFLSVIAHHKKNCAVKHDFLKSGRIVSMHFHVVLNTLYKMSYIFLAKAAPMTTVLTPGGDGSRVVLVHLTEHSLTLECLNRIKEVLQIAVFYVMQSINHMDFECHQVEPHITSKLHVWKKQYSTLVTMMSKSGLDWDYSRYMVTVDDNTALGREEDPPLSYNLNIDPMVNPSSVTKHMTTSSKKHKPQEAWPEIPQLVSIVTNFCDIANTCLGSLTRVLKKEFGDLDQRVTVLDAIKQLPGFQYKDCLLVARRLGRDSKDMEFFFSLGMKEK